MLIRAQSYFSSLRALFGTWGALRFMATYLFYRVFPPTSHALGRIRVGSLWCYFPTTQLLSGLFKEIFFDETYYLEKTEKSIRVIDCGANIGISLLYIKFRAPNAQVVCFEPNPAARKVLEYTISANRWEHSVVVHPYALSNSEGTATFYVDEDNDTSSGGSLSQYLSDYKDLHSYSVSVRTLSSFITEPVDVLKIDTEGSEFAIVEDLIATGALLSVHQLQIEYHFHPVHFPRHLTELLTLLEQQGFSVFAHPTARPHSIVGRTVKHQYMVFAWRNTFAQQN